MKNKKSKIFLLLSIAILAVFIPSNIIFQKYSSDKDFGLALHQANGIIRLASGSFGTAGINEVDDLFNVMQALKDTYGIQDARKEFSYDKTIAAAFGSTHKLSQEYNGYSVFGRSVTVATNKSGDVLSISGNYSKDIKPRNRIAISLENALQIIKNTYKNTAVFSGTLEIYSLNSPPVYAYNIPTAWNNGTRFFVDAQDGSIIEAIPTSSNETIPTEAHKTEQIDYYQDTVDVTLERTISQDPNGYTYYLADCLRNIYLVDSKESYDFIGDYYQNNTGIFSDRVAVTAFLNFVKTFDFYANPANIGVSLRGVDNSVNMIHDDAEEANEPLIYAFLHFGQQYVNAAYMSGFKAENSQEVVFIFGDGNPNTLFDLATSLDVVAHEYQHAITAYSADLIYLNAAGAINEAYSDIFGALVQGHDLTDDAFWHIGEDIINPNYQYALRDMKNPRALNYPDSYQGQYFQQFCYINHDHNNSSCDSGGVHTNSSIVAHAAYEMYRLKPELFTKQLMGELWYSTLLLLPQDAEFSDLRILMKQAATALNYSQEIIHTIETGFDNVGIFGSSDTHTISFNKGYDVQGDAPATIVLQYGETFVIPHSNISKSGYELSGWSEDGTLNNKIYIEGETYIMGGKNLALWPIFSVAMWNNLTPALWSGDGSFNAPYLIQSETDLATLAYYINNWATKEAPQNFRFAYFKQTRDLNLQNINWVPIGVQRYMNNLNYMLANYDGGGHKIYNLKIEGNPYNARGLGLFGTIDFSVKNLGIESGSIRGSAACVAGIGADLFGTVENCYNKADIENLNESTDKKNNLTAGVVGSALDIKNCYNMGNVKGNLIVGGVAAAISRKITDCFNTGDITGGYSAGGIFGAFSSEYAQGIRIDGTISWYSPHSAVVGNCYNTGGIIGENAGGIAGETSDVYYANCINTGAISGVSANSCIGGIVGRASFGQGLWSANVISKSEGTMILGCKNTGYIDPLNVSYAGGIVGRLFCENKGYVLFEKNIFKTQGGLSDIGNYNSFNQYMKDNFHGNPAKSSNSNNFDGDFDFDNPEYYNDNSIWATTSWAAKFGIGHEWKILSSNTMPVPAQPEYWTDYRAESFDGGNGTTSNPYKIATAEQLALLAWIVNFNNGMLGDTHVNRSCFSLTNDIDLKGKVWLGIGCEYHLWLSGGGGSIWGYSNAFIGQFDGKGYKITNMYSREYTWYQNDFSYGFDQAATRVSTSSAALFGSIGGHYSGVVVKNIIVENCDVLGQTAAAVVANASAIDAIENCEVIGGSVSGFQIAGGIVGLWNGWHLEQRVKECFNSAEIYGSNAIGGIIGATDTSFTSGTSIVYDINNCINIGALTNFGENIPSDSVIGGIIGKAYEGKFNISGCINTGKLTHYDYFGIIGGIVGYCAKATVNMRNCVQYGEYNYRETEYSIVGGLVSVPLQNGFYSIDSSIYIYDCVFNSLNKAVADMPFGFDSPVVSLTNALYSTDLKYFDFENLDYFKNYLDLNDTLASWFYARFNKMVMLDLYKSGILFQRILLQIGEQIEHLPHLETANGFGWWKIMVDNTYVQILLPFEIDRDTVAVFDETLTGHSLREWETVIHATCENNGLEKRVCDTCGYVETREIPALGHDLTHYTAESATCTEDGNIEYWYCERCDKYFSDVAAQTEVTQAETIISALGHTFGEIFIEEPTCTHIGRTYHICSKCGLTETIEEIEALPHTESIWLTEQVVACTTNGSYYKKCTECGKILETYEVPALGHDLEHHESKESTCISHGWNEYDTCSRCDYNTCEKTDKFSHIESGWIIEKEAAVGIEGEKYKECTKCGKILEKEKIPALSESCMGCGSIDFSNGNNKKKGIMIPIIFLLIFPTIFILLKKKSPKSV